MPADDRELVIALARLAHLELPPEEARALGDQLDTILGYIRGLQAVDVEGVPEYLTAAQVRSGLRDDVSSGLESGSGMDIEQALAGVPVVHDRLVAVPKFKD